MPEVTKNQDENEMEFMKATPNDGEKDEAVLVNDENTFGNIEETEENGSDNLDGENAESVLVNDDNTFGNIEETEEHESENLEGANKECELCKNSSQHPCRKYGQNVCILFCSIPDPTSDNEMHVIHKDSTRCSTVSNLFHILQK